MPLSFYENPWGTDGKSSGPFLFLESIWVPMGGFRCIFDQAPEFTRPTAMIAEIDNLTESTAGLMFTCRHAAPEGGARLHMFNMFDMLNQAQNGAAMENLSRQFGLHPDQTKKAVEALMPAFQEGMRRQVESMEAMQAFYKQMGSGNYERYFEDPEAAETEEVKQSGNDILGQLFGSKDVSRAVADQASAMTGLGADIMKQMLPVIASMMMGGLQRQTGGNPFQQMFEQIMGGGRGGAGANPFGDMLQGMLGNMFGGGAGMPGRAGQGGFNPAEIIDALFTAGRKTQDANTEAMGRIFDQFTGGKR